MALRLGIDTGGTFTDAALLADGGRVVATAKALTTPHDLVLGIRAALSGLTAADFNTVSLVGLSTTLATNAVVEGHGAAVGAVLLGYRSAQIERSGIAALVESANVITLDAAHDEINLPQATVTA